ncbi:hypothetical protein [Stenotrophomonas lacuserhaii]|uniref:hypothetical protein n=1 Tax=Stenotrophomonas lacuserhaii TaxID=2760084 RepID=UPI0015FDBBF7|nr:hypothetical protein [Stenotrophomonas lacuserhaii]
MSMVLSLMMLGLALTHAEGAAAAAASKVPTDSEARTAVRAVLQRIPGDDIQHDYRPLQVRVADLDGDGVAEIIHVYSSTYTGGTFEQSNELVVMTALSEGDRRGQVPHPGANAIDDSDMAAIRAAGYATDAEEHVPGRLDALQVADGKIIVRFTAAAGSTFCFEKDRERAKLEGCPTPGPHVWRFDWSPGQLQRIQ